MNGRPDLSTSSPAPLVKRLSFDEDRFVQIMAGYRGLKSNRKVVSIESQASRDHRKMLRTSSYGPRF
jgi:hypothetical protein